MLCSVATLLGPEPPAERMCTRRLVESERKPRLAQCNQIQAEATSVATPWSYKRMRARPTVESPRNKSARKPQNPLRSKPRVSFCPGGKQNLPTQRREPLRTGWHATKRDACCPSTRASTTERSGAACCTCYIYAMRRPGSQLILPWPRQICGLRQSTARTKKRTHAVRARLAGRASICPARAIERASTDCTSQKPWELTGLSPSLASMLESASL